MVSPRPQTPADPGRVPKGPIELAKLIFIGLFAVCVAGMWVFQLGWVRPAKLCEQRHAWFDWSTRTCAQPIYIPALTGRRPGETREQASARRIRARVEQDLREQAELGDRQREKLARQ